MCQGCGSALERRDLCLLAFCMWRWPRQNTLHKYNATSLDHPGLSSKALALPKFTPKTNVVVLSLLAFSAKASAPSTIKINTQCYGDAKRCPKVLKKVVQTIIIQFKSKQVLNILTSYLRYLIASHYNFYAIIHYIKFYH